MNTKSATPECQTQGLVEATSPISQWRVRTGQLGHYLRRDGIIPTSARLISSFRARLAGAHHHAGIPGMRVGHGRKEESDEILNLQPGEWIQVKSVAEIRKTLDSHGRFRGLSFSSEMVEYCGRRMKVL